MMRQALLYALILASCVDQVDLRLPPSSSGFPDATVEPPKDASTDEPDAGHEPPPSCEAQGFFCADVQCPQDQVPIEGLECARMGQLCCAPTPTCDQLGFICLDANTSTVCPPNWRVEMFECPNAPFTLCCGR